MTDWTPERLRDLRDYVAATQAMLADALGVSPNTWARWERGEVIPTAAHRGHLDTLDAIRRRWPGELFSILFNSPR